MGGEFTTAMIFCLRWRLARYILAQRRRRKKRQVIATSKSSLQDNTGPILLPDHLPIKPEPNTTLPSLQEGLSSPPPLPTAAELYNHTQNQEDGWVRLAGKIVAGGKGFGLIGMPLLTA